MKVTKGEPIWDDKEVIAFYTGQQLVFRDSHSDKNCTLAGKSIYRGSVEFNEYLKQSKYKLDFIAFYKGDTINIQL